MKTNEYVISFKDMSGFTYESFRDIREAAYEEGLHIYGDFNAQPQSAIFADEEYCIIEIKEPEYINSELLIETYLKRISKNMLHRKLCYKTQLVDNNLFSYKLVENA